MTHIKHNKGFLAISTVIMIASVVLIIAVTVSLTGIGEAQSSLAINKGEANLALVESCAEDALLKARSNSTFGDPVGTSVNVTLPEGTCVITVIAKSGTNPVTWTVNIETTNVVHDRKIQVIFTRNSSGVTLSSWREI